MLFYGISLIMKEKSNASALLSSQTQPNLGAGTTASGSRDDRLWAVLRLNAARRSLTSLGDFLAEIFEVTK